MRLLVGPLQDAGRLCAAHRPSHLVSWLSPPAETPQVADGPKHRLLLVSHDLTEPRDGYAPPTAEHLGRLLAFAETWDGSRPMLVHCWAGVSRSTAAAYVIACARRPGCEHELAQTLRLASPGATPNALIVSLADALLGRGGRMVEAIAQIGRGAEVSLGAAFELKLG